MKGPEWMIGFSKATRQNSARCRPQWNETNRLTEKTNTNFDTMVEKLDKLDKGESKHKVIIEYEYAGFDPSKPGMALPPGRAVGAP